MRTFYLGTHRPHWLRCLDVPLFVSHRTLQRYRKLPRARAPWALDSGGFTEIGTYGEWRTTVSGYIEGVQRYAGEVGRLDWAAPMDWMCEPHMVARTGLSVREHQERTVQNYLDLCGHGPFMPVLQGWALDDYERCVQLYDEAGVDLTAEPAVGVGSVCRRQDTAEIGRIFRLLSRAGIACHGFGVKKEGVAQYGHYLTSADSMAWSFCARRDPPLPGCEHRTCTNCWLYALRWRGELLAGQCLYEQMEML